MTFALPKTNNYKIIRAFHRSIKLGKSLDAAALLPNATATEKAALAAKEKEDDVPEKRELEAEVESEAKRVKV